MSKKAVIPSEEDLNLFMCFFTRVAGWKMCDGVSHSDGPPPISAEESWLLVPRAARHAVRILWENFYSRWNKALYSLGRRRSSAVIGIPPPAMSEGPVAAEFRPVLETTDWRAGKMILKIGDFFREADAAAVRAMQEAGWDTSAVEGV